MLDRHHQHTQKATPHSIKLFGSQSQPFLMRHLLGIKQGGLLHASYGISVEKCSQSIPISST